MNELEEKLKWAKKKAETEPNKNIEHLVRIFTCQIILKNFHYGDLAGFS